MDLTHFYNEEINILNENDKNFGLFEKICHNFTVFRYRQWNYSLTNVNSEKQNNLNDKKLNLLVHNETLINYSNITKKNIIPMNFIH